MANRHGVLYGSVRGDCRTFNGDIIDWLTSLGLAEYAPAFLENRVDASVLEALTDQDLKDLGVARIGDRRKLTMAIAKRAKALASSGTFGPQLEGTLAGFEPTPELPEIAEAQRLLASLT